MFDYLKKYCGIIDLPVRIKLKNGINKYGVLLDYLSIEDQPEENELKDYRFVCNSKIMIYQQTENPILIEYISGNAIAYLDRFLK